MGETEVANIGSQNLASVLVKGVKEALDGNLADNVETKGVKAHFQLDDSGILTCTHVESVFEKTVSPEEQEKKGKKLRTALIGQNWGTISKVSSAAIPRKRKKTPKAIKKRMSKKMPRKTKMRKMLRRMIKKMIRKRRKMINLRNRRNPK